MDNKAKVASDDIRDTPEGWCVVTTALSRWFGATFAADTGNALLVVKSDRKSPPEASFDLASVGGLRDRISGRRIDAQNEVYAASEVGRVASDARLPSDRNGVPSTLRMQAYRTDPKARLLGPLKATTVASGCIQGFATSLVSSAGRGANFGCGGWRRNFGLERGLDAKTSVAAFAHSLIFDGFARQNYYVEGSLRRALSSALIEVTGAAAQRAQAIGEIRRTRYTVESICANGFRSDGLQPGTTGLQSVTLAQLFGYGSATMAASITARVTTRSTGTRDVALRVSANVGRVSLIGELRWRADLVRIGIDPPWHHEGSLACQCLHRHGPPAR